MGNETKLVPELFKRFVIHNNYDESVNDDFSHLKANLRNSKPKKNRSKAKQAKKSRKINRRK